MVMATIIKNHKMSLNMVNIISMSGAMLSTKLMKYMHLMYSAMIPTDSRIRSRFMCNSNSSSVYYKYTFISMLI